MRGRKPTPTALKIVRGNPGKRALPKDEPQLPLAPATSDAPPELADDTGALAEWRRLEPLLRSARVLTDGDRAALVAACQQWSRYVEANTKVRLAGLVVKAPKTDYPMMNPYLPIANRALNLCVKLWAELGLTPSSRTRVGAAGDAKAAADLDAFLQS